MFTGFFNSYCLTNTFICTILLIPNCFYCLNVFLEKVKKGEPTLDIENRLAGINMQQILEEITNDAAKKTFWINMYNAWYQLLASREQLKRPEIFTRKVHFNCRCQVQFR